MLRNILRENPRSPPSIRYGIGLCYYRLGNVEKASLAFKRVLELEPDNVMALISLTIVEISQQYYDDDVRKDVQDLLQRAYEIDDQHPLVLRYLAEHYFMSNKFIIANKMCATGLKNLERFKKNENNLKENPTFRRELDFLKSDLFFIQGKIKHVEEEYQDALGLYQKAIKMNSQNFAAQFNLAKVYFCFNQL